MSKSPLVDNYASDICKAASELMEVSKAFDPKTIVELDCMRLALGDVTSAINWLKHGNPRGVS